MTNSPHRIRRRLGAASSVGLLIAAVLVVAAPSPASARPLCPEPIILDERLPEHPVDFEVMPDPDCGGWTPPPPPPPPPDPGFDTVLTIGDSFASGTGRHIYARDHDEVHGGIEQGLQLKPSGTDCWREWHDTPGPRVARTYGSANYFLACKGAETWNVRNQMTVANTRYPAKRNSGWSRSLIVVVAGGNDIRSGSRTWPDVIKKCITSSCGNHSYHPTNYPQVQNNLVGLYRQLAQQAPNSRVRVLGYPHLMKPSSNCRYVTGVSAGEARWIDQRVDFLNNNVATAVSRVKAEYPNFDIRFVPVTGYFQTGACSSSGWNKAHVNDKVVDGIFSHSHASFHPSLSGYGRYEAALRANLN